MAKQVAESGVDAAHKSKQVGSVGVGADYLLQHNMYQINSVMKFGLFLLLGIICKHPG